MTDKFVFVVTCNKCGKLIKVADDPSDGVDQYVADADAAEDLNVQQLRFDGSLSSQSSTACSGSTDLLIGTSIVPSFSK